MVCDNTVLGVAAKQLNICYKTHSLENYFQVPKLVSCILST